MFTLKPRSSAPLPASSVQEGSCDGEPERLKGRERRTQLLIHIPAAAERYRKGSGEIRPYMKMQHQPFGLCVISIHLSGKSAFCASHLQQTREFAALQPLHLTKSSNTVKKVAAFRKGFSPPGQNPSLQGKEKHLYRLLRWRQKRLKKGQTWRPTQSLCTTNTVHETTTHPQKRSA